MKYRIHFEPMDIEGTSPDDCEAYYITQRDCKPNISKILPIDKDGFIIEQPKQVE